MGHSPFSKSKLANRSFVAPQNHAAQDSQLIGNDANVFRDLECDLLGVAAAQVEEVVVEQRVDLLDGFLQPDIPLVLAVLVEPTPPEVVLVGVLAPWVMPDLEAR